MADDTPPWETRLGAPAASPPPWEARLGEKKDSKISSVDASLPTEKSTFTGDAALMHRIGDDEPGYEYGDILPMKTNIKTREHSWAMPEMIRSPIRGVGDLISTAQMKGEKPTPDAISAITTIMPGFKPAAKAVTKSAEMVGGKVLDMAGKARELVNAKSDSMAKNAAIENIPLPESLLKGSGGKPLVVTPKSIEAGRNILQTALKEDDINPLDVAQRLEEAKATGLPMTAADVITKEVGGVHTHGKNAMGLLKGAANMPGPGASMAGEVAVRGADTTKRIGNALDIAMTNKGAYEVSDTALEKMQTETPKAYKTAFEGGSIAPLEKQFEGEFQKAAIAKSSAQQKIAAAKQQILHIEAKKQTNANVYVDNTLISAKRKAYESLQSAQKELSAAQKNEDSVKELLQQAQSDRKSGVKGAVWSPRIQEMLGDDTIQKGIKKGLWIAQKEALANGEKFNPSEYGIIGYEAGEPIVSKVPNMRMLDAGKKGLDAIINESKNPLTGKMNETGRAVTMLKNAYTKEIDRMNPDYAKARASYGDQASQLQALESGRTFTRMDKEEISRFMKDPNVSKAEKSAFATGVRRKLQEILDEDPTNPMRQIWRTSIKDKLEAVFPNKQVLDRFEKLMEHEQAMARVNSALATQSHTNMLGNFQKQISAPGKYVKAITNPQGAAFDYGMDVMSKSLQKQAKNMSKEQAAIIARYLTTDDPQVWYDLANRTTIAP